MVSISSLPTEVWICGAVLLLMGMAAGFAAGVIFERTAAKRAFRKAQKHLSQLYAVVVEQLDSAQKACSLLEAFPGIVLSGNQTEQLDNKRGSLVETMKRIVTRQHELTIVSESEKVKTIIAEAPDAIEWMKSSVDDATGLPSRLDFDMNLSLMLADTREYERESGILLIHADKLEHLKSRFGMDGANQFLKRMSGLICRAVRDEDLVCQWNQDTIAVLIPAMSYDAGRRLAESIRNTIRHHHFRLEETGPEVLVTASFGYAICQPGDNEDLLLSKAGDALAKSKRKGRNQLHVYDGSKLEHCLAG